MNSVQIGKVAVTDTTTYLWAPLKISFSEKIQMIPSTKVHH
jgi:hypothetical protein